MWWATTCTSERSRQGQRAQTSYAFSGLSCGTSYTVGVDAYDAAGNRSAVSWLIVTTGACADTSPPRRTDESRRECRHRLGHLRSLDGLDRQRWCHGLSRLCRRCPRRYDRDDLLHRDRAVVRQLTPGRCRRLRRRRQPLPADVGHDGDLGLPRSLARRHPAADRAHRSSRRFGRADHDRADLERFHRQCRRRRLRRLRERLPGGFADHDRLHADGPDLRDLLHRRSRRL